MCPTYSPLLAESESRELYTPVDFQIAELQVPYMGTDYRQVGRVRRVTTETSAIKKNEVGPKSPNYKLLSYSADLNLRVICVSNVYSQSRYTPNVHSLHASRILFRSLLFILLGNLLVMAQLRLINTLRLIILKDSIIGYTQRCVT